MKLEAIKTRKLQRATLKTPMGEVKLQHVENLVRCETNNAYVINTLKRVYGFYELADEPDPEKDALEKLSVADLKTLAKERGLTGTSKLRKEDLVDVILLDMQSEAFEKEHGKVPEELIQG